MGVVAGGGHHRRVGQPDPARDVGDADDVRVDLRRVDERVEATGATGAGEVDLDALIARAVHLRTAPTFSSYPVAKEDVALVVDDSVPAADVEAALRVGARFLVRLAESVRAGAEASA